MKIRSSYNSFLGTCVPHKIGALLFQPFCRLLDTNRQTNQQTNRQAKYIDRCTLYNTLRGNILIRRNVMFEGNWNIFLVNIFNPAYRTHHRRKRTRRMTSQLMLTLNRMLLTLNRMLMTLNRKLLKN